jgi:hypothetical protein
LAFSRSPARVTPVSAPADRQKHLVIIGARWQYAKIQMEESCAQRPCMVSLVAA